MRLTTTNGTVTLTSENKKEAMQLFAYALDRQNTEVIELPSQMRVKTKNIKVRKHKRHIFTKRCQFCNKPCRGGTGLASHERHCAENPNRRERKNLPSLTGMIPVQQG